MKQNEKVICGRRSGRNQAQNSQKAVQSGSRFHGAKKSHLEYFQILSEKVNGALIGKELMTSQ